MSAGTLKLGMYHRALVSIMIYSKSDHNMKFSYFKAMPIWEALYSTKHVINREKIHKITARTLIIRMYMDMLQTREVQKSSMH